MALTEKQKRFCDEYLIDLNATQAAIRAGYSKKTANRTGPENLSKPVIKAYIDAKMAEKDAELIAAQDEVMRHLTAAMRGEITEEVVVVEGTGEGCSDARIVDKQISARDRLKAAELLGKRYQLFTDKVDVTGAIPVVLVDDVPDEE
ncbi:terminase small subunit [Zhenpiania hominis]|uniref:Terminase small subunit n=1 Tax=Zhenpiania hominis TaxID=2763644 RepID=A0A923STF7_9FIRM|nr:terminase small subunit [Zhenpiania hominis]MBC6681389.1 terminase small subunit [Zhenpiania hominis]